MFENFYEMLLGSVPLIFAAFCVCGARYKMKVFISFFAVLAFVWPGLNSRAGIL